MADFKTSLALIYKVEYNNNPKKALHQVKGEDFITYKGINRKAWPNWAGWKIIDTYLNGAPKVTEAISVQCNNDSELEEMVLQFYRVNFWNKNSLDKINSQHIADEIFVSSVLTHPRTAAKFAQKVIGVPVDGAIGPITIKKLNEYDVALFDKKYDQEEINHYVELIAQKPKFKIYEKGWKNRAVIV
jgi:hypothetical protein